MTAIAIIEDEPTDFAALARVLGREREPAHWTTGRAAIDALGRDDALAKIALVVVDLGLPDMHGTEVIEALRALPRGDRPVIVVLTESTDEAERRAAAEAGADGYYVKPNTVAELRAIAAQIKATSGLEL